MNLSLKRLLSMALALCLCLTMVPVVCVSAETIPAISDQTTTTIIGANGKVTVTTSKVVLENPNQNHQLAAVVDTTALTGTTGSWKIKISGSTSNIYQYPNSVNQKSWYLNSFTHGWQTVTVTVYDNNGAEYGTGTLELYFGTQEEYPMTDAEVAASAGTMDVPAGTLSLSVYTYFGPTSDVEQDTEVYVELLDHTGAVYGATYGTNLGYIYKATTEDTRYQEIFPNGVPYAASCMRVSAYLLCGKELVPGTYSLRFYTEDKSFEKTVPNAVTVSDSLMANLEYSGNGYLSYDESLGMVGAVVSITNGSPSDFRVQLLQGGTVLAVSDAYRPVQVSGANDLVMQYYIPVDQEMFVDETVIKDLLAELRKESLEDLTEEELEWVLSQASGRMDDLSLKLVSTTGANILGETEWSFEEDGPGFILDMCYFSSHFYANAVLTSTGYDPEETYKLELVDNSTGNILGEVLASPDERGIFNVEFTDGNGEPLRLDTTQWKDYQVKLYENWSGQWYSYASVWLRTQMLRSVSAATLFSDEETLALDIYAFMSMAEDGSIEFYLEGSEEDLEKLNDCELQLTPVGSSSVIVVDNAKMDTTQTQGYGWLYFMPEQPLTHGYYTGKLYCGDKLVTDLNGVSVLESRNLEVSDIVSGNLWTDYLLDNPLQLYSGGGLKNAGSLEKAKVDFYAVGNRTGTPEKSYSVNLHNGSFFLTPAQIEELGNSRYQTVLWADDIPIDLIEPEFWIADEWSSAYWTYYHQNGTVQRFGVSVDSQIADKAAIELIPCFGGTDINGDFQAFTEVYVKVTPASGQILDKILVNDKPIDGRAFILTKDDTVVSATFKEAKKYQIDTEIYDYNNYKIDPTLATVEVSAEAAVPGETVTVSVTPKGGYVWDGTYVRDSSGNLETTTNDDGTFSFIMPEGDTTIRVYMRTRRNLTVELYGGGVYGTMSVTPEGQLMEGDTFTLTVIPAEGYYLTKLTLSYYDYGAYEDVEEVLLETPTSETYQKTISNLNTSYASVTAEFAEKTAYLINISSMTGGTIAADKTTAYPGETVTLSVQPDKNYRQNGAVKINYSTTGGSYSVTPTENANGTWSFTMPWADVHISTSFIFSAPGGEVNTPEALNTALGGVHTVDQETGTVKLTKDLVLEKPVVILGDAGVLDMNGYDIYGPAFSLDAQSCGVICMKTDGALRITSNATSYIMPDKTGTHGIHVLDGKLTVDGSVYVYSVEATSMDAAAAIMVEGGSVTLGEKGAESAPSAYGKRCGDGVRITGGETVILSGAYIGGTEFNYEYSMDEVSLLGGVEDDSSYDGSSRGGNAVHVSDAGDLRIDNGYFQSGLNQAGVKVSAGKSATATGKIRIRGGQINPEYYDNYGYGLWVDCQPKDLILSGGVYRYSYNSYGHNHAIHLKNTKLSAYLAEGASVVDASSGGPMSPEATYYYEVQIILSASAKLEENLNDQLEALGDKNPTEDQKNALVGTVQTGFDGMDADEKIAAMTDPELVEQIKTVETKLAIPVKVQADADSPVQGGSVVGAAINAAAGARELVLRIQKSSGATVPSGYQEDGVQLKLTLDGVKDADTDMAGTQLRVPVEITLPLPKGVNPAYVAVLHADSEGASLHTTVDLEYDTVTFVADTLGDFVLTEAVSAEKTDDNCVQVTVAQLHDTDVMVACAVYDADGKQLSMTMVNGQDLQGGTLVACDTQEAYHVKLFLLDSDNDPCYAMERITLKNT